MTTLPTTAGHCSSSGRNYRLPSALVSSAKPRDSDSLDVGTRSLNEARGARDLTAVLSFEE